ncbi:MAG: cyclodeaminase/cyclohydrolase family protein, partial [Fidelibacterota bacterium]
EGRLVDLSAENFVRECSRNSPAPGGGSVSALAAELGAALASMVAALTFEKKGNWSLREEMETLGNRAQELAARLNQLVDADTEAFNQVLAAQRLPSGNDTEKARKKAAVLAANKEAIHVPYQTLEAAWNVLELAGKLVEKGNPASVSDAGVAAEMALAAIHGAGMNVLINLPGVSADPDFAREMKTAVGERTEAAERVIREVRAAVSSVISS